MLHTTFVWAGITGTGLIVTVNVNTAPAHPVGDNAVIKYVAVCTVFVGLVNVPVIILVPLADTPPVTPPVTVGNDQLYVVPSGMIVVGALFVSRCVNVPPLHIVSLCAGTTGVGLIVTVNVNTAPAHPVGDNGVITYVAVCTVLVGLVNVPVMILCNVPDAPPVTPPVTVGADQLYFVPTGTISSPLMPPPLTGVNTKLSLLHIISSLALIEGFGLIVTVNVNTSPGHPVGDNGVITYVAVCTVLVGLVSVPVIILVPLADAPPVTPPVTVGDDQLYVVPTGTIVVGALFIIECINVVPLHTVSLCAGITGIGLIVTVNVNTAPAHPVGDNAVIKYVAVCTVLVGLVNVPVIILVPLADDPPVTPPVTVGNDQLYVVPSGIIVVGALFVSRCVNVSPLHIVSLCAGTTGVGLIVTVNVNTSPGHPVGDNGVITYVAVCTVLVGLVSVPVIILVPLADAPPVTPPVTVGADQLYLVPTGTIVVGSAFTIV